MDQEMQPSDSKSVEAAILRILREELRVQPKLLEGCGRETRLFGRGLGLDSMETLTLVSAMEKEFDILVPDEDLEISLFESLGTLTDYVLHRIDKEIR